MRRALAYCLRSSSAASSKSAVAGYVTEATRQEKAAAEGGAIDRGEDSRARLLFRDEKKRKRKNR